MIYSWPFVTVLQILNSPDSYGYQNNNNTDGQHGNDDPAYDVPDIVRIICNKSKRNQNEKKNCHVIALSYRVETCTMFCAIFVWRTNQLFSTIFERKKLSHVNRKKKVQTRRIPYCVIVKRHEGKFEYRFSLTNQVQRPRTKFLKTVFSPHRKIL